MTGKIDRDHWHPGFLGAMELEFIDYKNELVFEGEHQLSKEPLKMDLLIIKKKKDAVIANQIGAIFRQYNIFEFKSPRDGLSIDNYIKTVGYAYLYKGMGKHVDEIPFSELTVSLVRDTVPDGLFRAIRKLGGTIDEAFPGIYYISGIVNIPTQFVLTSQLESEYHASLRLLTENVQEEDIVKFLNAVIGYQDPGDRQNIDAVLTVSSAANLGVFENLKRKSETMSDALKELMKEEIREEVDNSLLTAIKNIMKNNGWEAKKVMDSMEIPPVDQVRYLALL